MPNLDNTLFMRHLRMRQRQTQQRQQEMAQAGEVASRTVEGVEKVREKAFQEGLKAAQQKGQVAAIRRDPKPSYPNPRMQEQADFGHAVQRHGQQEKSKERAQEKAIRSIAVLRERLEAKEKHRRAMALEKLRQQGLTERGKRKQANWERDHAVRKRNAAANEAASNMDVAHSLKGLAAQETAAIRVIEEDILGRKADPERLANLEQRRDYLMDLAAEAAKRATPEVIRDALVSRGVSDPFAREITDSGQPTAPPPAATTKPSPQDMEALLSKAYSELTPEEQRLLMEWNKAQE